MNIKELTAELLYDDIREELWDKRGEHRDSEIGCIEMNPELYYKLIPALNPIECEDFVIKKKLCGYPLVINEKIESFRVISGIKES